MYKLTQLEEFLLVSSDEDGRIPFPQGRANDVDGQMRELVRMEKKGFLQRNSSAGWTRGFYLTEMGKTLKAECAS